MTRDQIPIGHWVLGLCWSLALGHCPLTHLLYISRARCAPGAHGAQLLLPKPRWPLKNDENIFGFFYAHLWRRLFPSRWIRWVADASSHRTHLADRFSRTGDEE